MVSDDVLEVAGDVFLDARQAAEDRCVIHTEQGTVAMRAALQELAAHGYAVVPVEPTEWMLVGLTGPSGYCSIPLKDAYKRMIDAAQEQPDAE